MQFEQLRADAKLSRDANAEVSLSTRRCIAEAHDRLRTAMQNLERANEAVATARLPTSPTPLRADDRARATERRVDDEAV